MRSTTWVGGRSRVGFFGAALAMALTACLVPIPVFAQSSTGTILGTVKDSSGGAMSGATVTAVNTETGSSRAVKAGDDGSYRFPALLVGHYSVKVEMQGFKAETHSGLILDVSQEAVTDFTLQVGASTQEITVTGEAPQVETTNSTLGGTVNEEKMAELPLNGRNYIDLTLLQPGVTHAAMAGNINSPTVGTWLSSNGAPPRSNNITLDGARLNNQQGATSASPGGNTLGVDGIREYKVVTDMFGAEYGLGMGSQVVMVSRGGSNQFHGDAFDYLRNDALDANNFFSVKKPPHRKNNFGGAFGGPIKRDKAFFYGVYEGIKEVVSPSAIVNVFDVSCYGANHVFLLANNPCAVNPNPTQAFPLGNPTGDVAPAVQKVVTLFPYPNHGTHQYVPFPYSNRNREDYGQIRFDQDLSAADTFFARYTVDKYSATNDSKFPEYQIVGSGMSNFITASESHIFSSQVLNTVRLSFSRTAAFSSNVVVSGPADCPTLTCPGYSMVSVGGVPLPTGAIIIGGTNFGATGGNGQKAIQNIYTLGDDLFYTKGRHALKFGLLINRFNEATLGAAAGNNSVAGETQWGSFNDLLNANFAFYDARVMTPLTNTDFIFTTIGMYVQDDFRTSSRLTLNLGVRYEFNTTPWELKGREYTHLNIRTDPLLGTHHSVMQNHSLKNVSPRIGFAYDVFGNGKTAVRGGFGEYFDVGNIGSALSQYGFAIQPLSSFFQITPGAAAPAFTIPFVNISNVAAPYQLVHHLDYYAKQPHVLQYNLAVQHQLPGNMALTLAYVGSRGINLFRLMDQNPNNTVPDPTNSFPGRPFWGTDPNVPQGRMNPNFGPARLITTGTNSWYNGLQGSLTMRAYHGLELQATYTYSRNLDTAQGQQYVFDCFSANGSGQGIDPFNTRTDKGPTCFDVPNNFRLNFLYHFPNVKSDNFVAKKILNGWWMGNIISIQSGYPFNANTVGLLSNSGVFGADQGERPNIITATNLAAAKAVDPAAVIYNPHGAITKDPNGWFNPHMFTLVGPKATAPCDTNAADPVGTLYGDTSHFNPDCYFGYLGNEGRNDMRGPHLRTWDFSLNKDTALPFLGEAGKLEFRAEFFNLLNHPNFGMPNNTIFNALDPRFGGAGSSEVPPDANGTTNVQGTYPNRQIQLALKIIF